MLYIVLYILMANCQDARAKDYRSIITINDLFRPLKISRSGLMPKGRCRITSVDR